jgi:hypothetical protein
MRVISRPADRFQRALEGERISDEQLAALVATSQHLVAVGSRAPGAAPDPDFVVALRQRLMAEAALLPTPSPAAAKAAASRRAAARGGPLVVVVGRGLPRALAGAAASALVVGSIVGIASRSAVPGDSLYAVKGWLDGVAVRLADSDFDRGTTHLSQAQTHISDARDLADRSQPDAGDINTALQDAIDSVRAGQRDLDTAWVETGNPQALLALRDFTARALPQIDALRTEVPPASLPRLGELEDLLRDSQQTAARRLAACGSRCSGIDSASFGPAALPSSLATAGSTGTAGPGGSSSTTSSGGITVPGAPVVGGGSSPAPGVSVGGDGATLGGPGGGASLGTGGATVNGPTVSASVPVVSSTAVLPLPSASVGTTGAGATLPSQTLGPITAPGATIKLP